MSVQKIKLDEILARTVAASEQKEQRKRDALAAWRAHEEQGALTRQKTEKLRALRLAREAAEAEAARKAAPAKAPRKAAAARS